MFVEIMLFTIAGISLGLLLSFIPGFHINNILPLLFSFGFLVNSPYGFSSLIISISVTQLFVSNITSVFLGAPNTDNFLSVLPGHRMLMQGKGYDAIFALVFGSLGSLFISLLLILVFFDHFSTLYDLSRPYIHYILIAVSFVLILSSRKASLVFGSLLVFALSGILGILVLNSSLINRQYSLFPLLSGLFGISLLFFSMNQKSSIPPQDNSKTVATSKNSIKNIFLGSLAGITVGFLPALGVSQAALMFNYLSFSKSSFDFLLTLGGINIGNEIFSIISLFLVNNPRSGASVAIQKLFPNITINEVIMHIGIILFTSSIASLLTLFLARRIPKYLAKMDYNKLCVFMILLISSLVFIFTGYLGLLVLFVSSSIGILCNYLGVRKSSCMGVLILPSILFFSGLNPFISSVLRI